MVVAGAGAAVCIWPGAAIASDAIGTLPGLVPVLPDQLEQCELTFADTSTLVGAYGTVSMSDRDGDGRVTDADFVRWVEEDLASSLVIRDLDGDGRLTATDEVGSFAIVLDKMSGDFDRDGVVTIEDTLTFFDLYDSPAVASLSEASADVTLDGVVSVEDLNAHLTTAMSGVTPDRVRTAVDILVRMRGSLTYTHYTSGHVEAITKTWGDRHCKDTSGFRDDGDRKKFPPNHGALYSDTWPSNHDKDLSAQWPAQHYGPWSGTWDDDHDQTISIGWPAGHWSDPSAAWNERPNRHSSFTSRRWPPNHRFDQSSGNNLPPHDQASSAFVPREDFPPDDTSPDPGNVPGFPEHSEHVSDGWGHNRTVSGYLWPNNHDVAMSNTWGPGHLVTAPGFWPSQHHGAVSQGWRPDEDGKMPWWPANHVHATSLKDLTPADEPEPPTWPGWLPKLFPDDHDIATTIREWTPFFSSN